MIIIAKGNELFLKKPEKLTQHTIGQKMVVLLDEKWNNLTTTVVFSSGKNKIDVVLSDNVITIPWELLREKGNAVYVNLYGTAENGNIVMTTDIISLGIVFPSNYPSEINPSDSTPSRIDQLQEIALRAQRMASVAMGYEPKTPTVVDSKPLNNSENLITSGGVQMSICRRNFLDNWYFGNAVNQRSGFIVPPGKNYYNEPRTGLSVSGVTDDYYTAAVISNSWVSIDVNGVLKYIYSANIGSGVPSSNCVRGYHGMGYGIDRWQCSNASDASLIISEGYITLKTGSQAPVFGQKFENYMWMYDTALHLSVLTDKGLFEASGTPILSGGVYQSPVIFLNDKWYCNVTGTASKTNLYIRFWCSTPASTINIYAIKLELGDTQTLAHQENGVWVLNEIPDYGEELMKCQRYYQIYRTQSMRPTYAVDCRPVMRTDPSQSTTAIGTVTCYANSADL